MRILMLAFGVAAWPLSCHAADLIRVKDLGKFEGWRDNALVGYGLVTGLAGTGDSPGNVATRQSIANVMANFDIVVTPEQVQSRNTAGVMVSASLPPFARPGETLDVTVTSIEDARSLAGGTLLLTPLKAANGKVYALAHGAISVGGYKYDAGGNVAQKNHPTAGAIPGGATVESAVSAAVLNQKHGLVFLLSNPDYTTASRIAAAVNAALGEGRARARDASGIVITVPPESEGAVVDFIARIEGLAIEPDRRARVVISERTGTVVAGGDVRISRVVVSHGELKVVVATEIAVSQPNFTVHGGSGVRTEVFANTKLQAAEQGETGFVAASNDTVADLVQALNRIKTNTRDIISILRAIKAAGALHAELIVQ